MKNNCVVRSISIHSSMLMIVIIELLFVGFSFGPVCANDLIRPTNLRPNILMFFIDDLGYKDLGCYGSEFYQTPNIDALASRSVRFTNFYAANPVCSPTRAAMMTGKAPQRIGITQWISQPSDIHLPHRETTLAEALSDTGYKTGYIGKWHLGEKDDQLPTSHGFDWMRCVNRAGQPASYFFPFARKSSSKRPSSAWDVPDLDDRKPGDYLTDEMTDHALTFITDNKDSPFFLCFAHYAVHTPIQAPKPVVEKYKKLTESLSVNGSDVIEERNGAKTRAHQTNPTYAAMIENLDVNVGRVLDHIEALGLRDQTLVVFTSDNGGLSTLRRLAPTSCRPLRAGKGWTYEGGIRIPTLFAWPGKIRPGVCKTPGITMDIFPTILELADLPAQPDQHVDGESLVTAINGNPMDALRSRYIAWTYPHKHGSGHTPSNAIRLGEWKLVQLLGSKTAEGEIELYNLSRDIGESQNLARKFPDKADQLKSLLDQWLKRTDRPQRDQSD